MKIQPKCRTPFKVEIRGLVWDFRDEMSWVSHQWSDLDLSCFRKGVSSSPGCFGKTCCCGHLCLCEHSPQLWNSPSYQAYLPYPGPAFICIPPHAFPQQPLASAVLFVALKQRLWYSEWCETNPSLSYSNSWFLPWQLLNGKQGITDEQCVTFTRGTAFSALFWGLSPSGMLFARHWVLVSPLSQWPQPCKLLSMLLTQYYGMAHCKALLDASGALSQMLHNSRGGSGIESRLLLKAYCYIQAFGLSAFCSQGSWELQGKIFLVYSRRKRAAKYCSVEPCSRTASHWPGVFHNNREAQEPWCIWSFFFSPYQLGAAFVLLCSSEVPVKSHIHGVLAVGCPCKSLLRLPRSCWGDSEPLAQVQRHPRALLVPFELGCEGYIPSSLTNTNGRFAQTCDVNV